MTLSTWKFSQFNGPMSVAYPTSGGTTRGQHSATSTVTNDGLLTMLAPIWQLAIGGCVLVVFVAASARLARRGRSRMTTALLVTGGAIVALTVIGALATAG